MGKWSILNTPEKQRENNQPLLAHLPFDGVVTSFFLGFDGILRDGQFFGDILYPIPFHATQKDFALLRGKLREDGIEAGNGFLRQCQTHGGGLILDMLIYPPLVNLPGGLFIPYKIQRAIIHRAVHIGRERFQIRETKRLIPQPDKTPLHDILCRIRIVDQLPRVGTQRRVVVAIKLLPGFIPLECNPLQKIALIL